MPTLVVVGAQWGDEGKGRVVDLLAAKADYVVRYQGGANAGHTVVVDGEKYVLHLIPSGIVHPGARCVIGNGVVLDPPMLFQEIDDLTARGLDVPAKLLVSERAHLTFPYHRIMDKVRDAGTRSIGTTQRGIGPTYTDKVARLGIRVADLLDEDLVKDRLEQNLTDKAPVLNLLPEDERPNLDEMVAACREYADRLRPYVADVAALLNTAIRQGKNILFEGAQGTGLDIDFGTYPYVTSSSAAAGGVCTGSGVGPTRIDRVIGIAKAYLTRVGRGPFPSKMEPAAEERARKRGNEFGATTGRPRDCGWFDLPLVRHSADINGLDGLIITKLDVLDEFDEIKICVAYRVGDRRLDRLPAGLRDLSACEPVFETLPGWNQSTTHARTLEDLPAAAQQYLQRLRDLTGVPIAAVSVGPSREEIILLDETLPTYSF